MKNVLTATAAIAAIFAGSAAFAEGGYVDELGFINAGQPGIHHEVKHENANSTLQTLQTVSRSGNHQIEATVFVNDSTTVAQDLLGR